MPKDRLPSQEVSLELGFDNRLLIEWFRRIQTRTFENDTQCEIENFGTFEMLQQKVKRSQYQFEISVHPPRNIMKLRPSIRPRETVQELRRGKAEIHFFAQSELVEIEFSLGWDSGLLLRQYIGRDFSVTRSTEPMEQQRMGISGNGPRIFMQTTIDDIKVKVNLVLDRNNNQFVILEPTPDEKDRLRLTAVAGDYVDKDTGLLKPWLLTLGNTSDQSSPWLFAPDTDDLAIYKLIRWMCINRSNDDNTGRFFPEDIVT